MLLLLALALTMPFLSRSDFTAPAFTVDLDVPPRARWTHVFDGFLRRHQKWAWTGGPAFAYLDHFGTPDQWFRRNKTLVAAGMKVLGEESVLESAGLIDFVNTPAVGANITLGALCFFQMFYELAMQCTGVIAETSEGTLHGRNLDIGLEVHNITGQITFRKNGTDIFTASQFLGYNGVHTGMRHRNAEGEGWSVQANERPSLVPGPLIGYKASGALMTVASFALGAMPVGAYLRQALTEHATYDDAIPFLESKHLASPMYVIVAGAERGQGGVLTRDRKGISRSNQFGFPIESQFRGKEGPAFQFAPVVGAAAAVADDDNQAPAFKAHIQTNWDWWISETHAECTAKMAAQPAWKTKLCDKALGIVYNDSTCSDLCQLYSDGRREGGRADLDARLAAMGNQADIDLIFAVMSNTTSRVLNWDTKITSIMNSRTGHYSTLVRENDAEAAEHAARERPQLLKEVVQEELIEAGKVMLNAVLETFG
jgi:hypothetical protein